MIREQKNKFWLTLILILSLSFSALAFSVVGIFAKKENVTVSASNLQVQEESAMSVAKWIKTEDGTSTSLEAGNAGLRFSVSGGTNFVISKRGENKDASNSYEVSNVEGTAVNEAQDLSYISNYTITIGSTTYSPIPENGYRVTGFNLLNKDGVKFSNVNSGSYTSEQIDPNYTGKIIVKAVCVPIEYKVYMYYSTNGTEWKQNTQTFTVAGTKPLEPVTAFAGGNVYKFKCWAIKAGVGETFETVNGKQVLKIGNIKFTYEGAQPTLETSGNGFQFYRVDKIEAGSYSNAIDNFKEANFSGTANYSSTNPTIRATWAYIYNGLIDNKASNIFDATKVGAYSTSDTNAESRKATLKIAADIDRYGYAFYKNTGKAFETNADNLLNLANSFGVDGKYYYVYNYGYEITGWYVYFDLSGNYRATFSGSDWTVSEGTKIKIDISTLGSSAKMSDLADKLDDFFIEGYPNAQITIEPCWTAVSIKMVANYKQGNEDKTAEISSTFNYNENYTISDSAVYTTPGQSIYNYTTTSGKIIAKHSSGGNIKFNYVKIPQSDFVYNTNVYTLNVKPDCVDDIYKVSLVGDSDFANRLYKSYSSGTYTYQLKDLESLDSITHNQYQFAKKTIDIPTLTISTVTGLTNRYEDYTSGSVETYIDTYVKPAKEEYKTKIKYGSLSVLRKVYTTGNVESNTLLYASTNAEENFFIYLANNQKSGYLPIFERNSYDLIAWDNLGTISYITEDYEEESHLNEFNGRTLKNPNNAAEFCTYYDLSNGGNAANLTLQAHYFRKNYLLDLNTLREGADEGRYGYIYVEIEDIAETGTALDKSGKFIAIHSGEEMQYFNATSASLAGIDGNALTANTNSLIREKDGVRYITLYAGCNLTIKASCVDSLTNTDADLAYQDMVGYYLSSVKTTNDYNSNQLFADINYSAVDNKRNGCVTKTITDEEINGNDDGNLGKNYKTNTIITINANFAPINYNLTIGLKSGTTPADAELNPFAGRVNCASKTTSTTEAELEFNVNVNVENWSATIEYIANAAGYTLQNGAITIVGLDGIKVLMSYNSNEATSETNSQEYAFILNGAWLLNNYYATEYVATTAVDGVTTESQLLDISVNTKLLTFEYHIEIVEDGEPLTSYQNGTMTLNGARDAVNVGIINVQDLKNALSNNNKQFSQISRLLVASEFEKISANENFYIIKYDGKNYAVLSSYLSQIMDGRNYTLNYNFLLKDTDITTTGDALTQERINAIYGVGNIVAPEDRVLRMQINVAEVYTLTMKAQAHAKPDSNSTVRTTTIKNHQDAHGAYTNSATLTTSGANFNNTQIIYTYKGVENIISSVYDTNHYIGVTYTLEGGLSNLESNSIVLDETMVDGNGNRNLIITYIPKPVTVFSVTYQRNGVEDSSVLGSVIEEIQKPNSEIELYYNQAVTYEYKLINPEYIATVTLNGDTVDANPVQCKVTSSVLDEGGFYLVVNVRELPKGAITLKYQIEDITYSCEGDNYGTFGVLIDGIDAVLTDEGDGWYSTFVVEGKSVKIDISGLKKGYHFVKLGTITEVEDNKILLTSAFDLDDDRVYYIVIRKDTVNAQLTAEGEYKNKYVMSTSEITANVVTSGNTTVTNIDVYVGKTLSFTYVDENREILDHYYYVGVDALGNEKEFEIPTIDNGDGTYTISLTIDETLLNNLADKVDNVWNLNIGVRRTPKYNLTYNVVNAGYIETFGMYQIEKEQLPGGIDVIIGDYVSGTNLISGSRLKFNIVVKDNKTDNDGNITEAKYNIVLSDCISSIIDTGSVTQTIELNEDKVLTITIMPKTYNDTIYTEGMYNELQDYKDLNSDELVTLIGGFAISSNLAYGSNAVASIKLVGVDSGSGEGQGELAVIRLSGNDANALIVHLDGKQIVSVYDETNNVEYVISEGFVKHSAATTQIANVEDILIMQGYNFNIDASSEKLNISYIVKNTISIKAEYVSYKTITPIG